MRQLALLLPITLLCVLLHLPSSLPTAASSFSSRTSDGILFQYTFEEGQLGDAADYSVDTVGRNLLGNINLNRSVCSFYPDRPGLQLSGFVNSSFAGASASTQAALQAEIQATGRFTMESWMKPESLQQAATIIGIGSWQDVPLATIFCKNDVVTYNFVQDGASVSSQEGSGPSWSSSCSSQQIGLDAPSLVHIATTYESNGTATMYVNGELYALQTSLSTWYPHWMPSHGLFLAPDLDPFTMLPWHGDFHLFAMYNRILTGAEIQTNYQAGLPDAKPQPVPRKSTLVGYQDTQSSYSITLNVTDFDTPSSSLSLLLLEAPAVGVLSILTEGDWRLVTSAYLPMTLDRMQEIQLRHTPPVGESGDNLAYFTFAGHDGTSMGRIGYVYFDIKPIPIPRSLTDVQAFVGVPRAIRLEASNSDGAQALVTALPTTGNLFQTVDGVNIAGLAITEEDLPAVVNNTDGFMFYVANTTFTQCSGHDSFEFMVRFPSGIESQDVGSITLQVCNRLFAQGANVTVNRPLAPLELTLQGYSMDSSEEVFAALTSLPMYGQLYDATTSEVVSLGSHIPSRTVIYRHDVDISAASQLTPPVYPSDSFSFRISNAQGLSSSIASIKLDSPAESAFSSRVTDGLQALYLFTEGEGTPGVGPQAPAIVHDQSSSKAGGDLHVDAGAQALNVSVAWLGNSPGIRFLGTSAKQSNLSASTYAPAAFTVSSDPPLYSSLLASQACTLEVWVDLPPTNAFGTGILLGIGYRALDGSVVLDFAISYVFGSMKLATFGTTRYIDPPTGVARTHLMLACDHASCTIYIDGGIKESFPTSSMPSLVDDGHPRQVFVGEGTTIAATSGITMWTGTMYLAAVYARKLDMAELSTNYHAAILPSWPQLRPANQTASVFQYSIGTPLESITFDAVAFNQTTTGAAAVALTDAATEIYITRLPVNGQLQMASADNATTPSSPLTPSDLPHLFSPTASQLVYTPPRGAFWGEAADSVELMASDGIRLSPVPAVISINVIQVVTPPIPLPATIAGYELTPIRVTLDGVDVDPNPPTNSPMEGIWIESFPSRGTLYMGFASNDTINLDAPLHPGELTLPYRVPKTIPLFYISNFGNTAAPAGGPIIVGADSFNFSVEVKSTRSNTTATASITLRNHLWAGNEDTESPPPALYRLAQPTLSTGDTVKVQVTMSGGIRADTGPNFYLPLISTPYESATFVILQLPLYGNLTNSIDGSVLCTGVSLPCPAAASSFDYTRDMAALPESDQQNDDTFLYATTTALHSTSGTVTMQSPAATVNIHMIPPRLAPLLSPSILRLDAESVKSYDAEGYNFTLKAIEQSLPEAALDPNAPPYRVSIGVTPQTGAFNLPHAFDEDVAPKIQFTSGGAEKSSIAIFRVQDVLTLNQVLAQMYFMPLYAGSYNITFTASATGPHSLTGSDQTHTSVVIFAVTGRDGTGNTDEGGGQGLLARLTNGQLLYVWLGVGGFILLCFMGFVIKRYRVCQRARRKKRREKEQDKKQAKTMEMLDKLVAVQLTGGKKLQNTNDTADEDKKKDKKGKKDKKDTKKDKKKDSKREDTKKDKKKDESKKKSDKEVPAEETDQSGDEGATEVTPVSETEIIDEDGSHSGIRALRDAWNNETIPSRRGPPLIYGDTMLGGSEANSLQSSRREGLTSSMSLDSLRSSRPPRGRMASLNRMGHSRLNCDLTHSMPIYSADSPPIEQVGPRPRLLRPRPNKRFIASQGPTADSAAQKTASGPGSSSSLSQSAPIPPPPTRNERFDLGNNDQEEEGEIPPPPPPPEEDDQDRPESPPPPPPPEEENGDTHGEHHQAQPANGTSADDIQIHLTEITPSTSSSHSTHSSPSRPPSMRRYASTSYSQGNPYASYDPYGTDGSYWDPHQRMQHIGPRICSHPQREQLYDETGYPYPAAAVPHHHHAATSATCLPPSHTPSRQHSRRPSTSSSRLSSSMPLQSPSRSLHGSGSGSAYGSGSSYGSGSGSGLRRQLLYHDQLEYYRQHQYAAAMQHGEVGMEYDHWGHQRQYSYHSQMSQPGGMSYSHAHYPAHHAYDDAYAYEHHDPYGYESWQQGAPAHGQYYGHEHSSNSHSVVDSANPGWEASQERSRSQRAHQHLHSCV